MFSTRLGLTKHFLVGTNVLQRNSSLRLHHCEMRQTSTEVFASSDVAIFWDYENCHAPCSVSGYQVVSGIRNVAHKYGSVKYFKAYMEVPDANAFSRALSLRSELQSSGVSVTDCPHNGRKDVADQMIMVDMLAYAIDHPLPATVILISGDRDFAYAVAILRLRRYEVIVISTLANVSLSSQASTWLDWNIHVLGNTNSSTRNGCMEPSSPSPSTSAVQQTPTMRKASCFGESFHTGFQFEQANPSPVRSISGPPRVSRDQPEVLCVPVLADATNIPTPRPNVVDPLWDTTGLRNALLLGVAILTPRLNVVDPPQDTGSLNPSPPGSATPTPRPNVINSLWDITGPRSPSPPGSSIPTPQPNIIDPLQDTSPLNPSPPSSAIPTPLQNVIEPPQDNGSLNTSPPCSTTPTPRSNVLDPPRDTSSPPNPSPPGSSILTPRLNVIDPPPNTSPPNPSPPHSTPEAELEQISLASPIHLFSENSLPPEKNIPPRPSSSPADLDRASSSNLDSPGAADSMLFFPGLQRVQSLNHGVPVTILSASPPPAEDSSVDGYYTAPTTTAMASPLIGTAEIHNLSQTVLDASRPAIPATFLNNFTRAEHSQNSSATSTGPPAPPLSSSSIPIPNRTVPNLAFQPLIAVLEKHHANGVMRPLRSTIKGELATSSKTVYAGVHGSRLFGQLVNLAETAGIIQLGDSGGKDWISLRATNLSAPRLAGAITPAGANNSTAVAANLPGNKVPVAFQPLVNVLLKYSAAGVTRPLRTNVGAELSKTIYFQAGVSTFKQFTALAEKATVVQTGGKGDDAWVSLHRNLTVV